MAPLPQQDINSVLNPQKDVLTGEEVVISGISGLFPNSKNVVEFMDNLYNKVDMVTKDDPSFEHADLPKYSGRISGTDKFDSQFFRVTYTQADSMEPMGRKIMEQAYGAMYDAGVNPLVFKGTRTGVFIAAYNMESANFVTENTKKNHFVMSGASKTMLANRISYWLDTKGPSFTIDSPSSSIICLEYALNCIRAGICDAAIVGGCEVTINDAILAVNLRNAGLLCLDGKTRCFDKNGDGGVKSQAVGTLFLQKAKDAKRIYAEICTAGQAYSLKDGDNFSSKRDTERIVDFLDTVYSNSKISQDTIEYVEAHGAANPDADANELDAVGKVFGKEKPVIVGCVKSNMGDSLSASATCAIIKLCLAYHRGELPGNLHYNDPLDIPVIRNGKVQVLTENKTFNRGLTAVNNFSHTGTDCHIVLKGHYKPKVLDVYKTELPRLVLVSGRHENAVKKIFDILEKQPVDPELIGMLNNIYQVETPGFTYRGYAIFDNTDSRRTALSKSTEFYKGTAPPLWFLYSGMGSQWAGMGAELMRIPIFAAAIKKCHKILEPKGVDVVKIITSPDNTLFDNVLNCFIGIAAVQIGLTNILKELGLVADNIIGHSVGEIGCAYYDGCFTDEEMILVAYARGLVSIQTKLIKGAMAAVGLGYKDMLPLCPPDIEIACHNSSEVCTISGPVDAMKTFVASLKAKGIFAKQVPCGNIAYHSRYIQDAGPGFLKHLKGIIKKPVKRSKNWISTSWPSDKCNEKDAVMCSAEYHTNNLLSPVYFEEAARNIPAKSVIIEVAPHSLMQAILKKSHPDCTYIPLTKRNHSNPMKYLIEAIGKLYQLGYNLKVDVLYPRIDYPVSTETSPLSHLVEWYHKDDWALRCTNLNDKRTTASRKFIISLQDDDYKFLAGHRREGNIVLPEAAILFFVWETLAMFKNVDLNIMSVVFREIHFHSEVVIDWDDKVNLNCCINNGDNYFEVTRDTVIIASGLIHAVSRLIQTSSCEIEKNIEGSDNDIELSSEDVYNILKLKGYVYQNDFQTIHSATNQRRSSKIKITSNWITFLDSLFQFNILVRNYDGVSVPKMIKRLSIDVKDNLFKTIDKDKENNMWDAYYHQDFEVTTCGGIKIDTIIFNDKPIVESVPDIIQFIPYVPTTTKEDFKNEREFKLVNDKPGEIDNLQWVEVDTEINIDQLVKVYFASPSMKDVQRSIGIVGKQKSYGMDFSGIDSKGNRVMGLVDSGALASTVEPDIDLLWPVPMHWSLEEAATVPLPYVHACYCLIVRGNLQKGQTVFISGGAGALGQAVISICLSMGCTIYTSVSDINKKRFLKRLFPTLNESHIGFSRDISFYYMVISNSKNKRCDLVINCATGFLREITMKCVGFVGHFLDVTDYDMRQNNRLGMRYLDEDKTYKTIDLSCIFKLENTEEKKVLHKLISEGIANGMVKPLSHVVYSTNDVAKAFRLISHSRHRGRALIRMRDPALKNYSMIPRISYSSNGVHLVVCDETELGIKLATHLIKRGARELILNLKSKMVTGFLQYQLSCSIKHYLSLGRKCDSQLVCINYTLVGNRSLSSLDEECTIKHLISKIQAKPSLLTPPRIYLVCKTLFVCNELLFIYYFIMFFFMNSSWKNMGATVKLSSDKLGNKENCANILMNEENLRGIYIISPKINFDSNMFLKTVSNLDDLSRNNHPELKNFVIFARYSTGDKDHFVSSAFKNICDKRVSIGLPALIIQAKLEDYEEDNRSEEQSTTVETALRAMEISLKNRYNNVVAYNKTKDNKEFLEKIYKIMGIKCLDTNDDSIRVQDFVCNDVNIEELKYAIKTNYKYEFSTKVIKEMTIQSLKNIFNDRKIVNTKFNYKLAAFYNFVDHDEIKATEVFVPMPTLSSSAEEERNLHAKVTNIILIPGFEGHHNIYKHMCDSLKIRATALQFGPDISNESINEIALYLKQRLLRRFPLEPKFYLLGYSFGVNLALEIAALLEKDGLVGVVYCLDSSPDALRVQLDAYLGKLSEEQLQNAVIKHLFSIMCGQKSDNFEQDIEKINNWKEKVDLCVEKLKNYVKFSNEYKRDIIEAFYKRLSLAKSYKPKFRLESDIVLLKGIPHPKADKLDVDYGLSKYAKNPVKVFNINSDIALAPYDCRVANFVNKLLEPALIDAFKAKNLCESYSCTTFV